MLTSYPFFLCALFVAGAGFRGAADRRQPVCDDSGAGANRFQPAESLAGVQFLCHTIGPIIGGWLIFTVFTDRVCMGRIR